MNVMEVVDDEVDEDEVDDPPNQIHQKRSRNLQNLHRVMCQLERKRKIQKVTQEIKQKFKHEANNPSVLWTASLIGSK
jgi:hypothetical protein